MTNITDTLLNIYKPTSMLVIYQKEDKSYVEHFDFDLEGMPINARPLSEQEGVRLSKVLSHQKTNKVFLHNQDLLPSNILHLNQNNNGLVVWHTKKKKQSLFFCKELGIENGKANVPPLLWIASKRGLHIFALKNNQRPTAKTVLYHAPFFNMHSDGAVCMGNVEIKIENTISVNEFIKSWENLFFNSYFSHLINGHNSINGNCVTLWKDLVNSSKPFPIEVLKKTKLTLSNVL